MGSEGKQASTSHRWFSRSPYECGNWTHLQPEPDKLRNTGPSLHNYSSENGKEIIFCCTSLQQTFFKNFSHIISTILVFCFFVVFFWEGGAKLKIKQNQQHPTSCFIRSQVLSQLDLSHPTTGTWKLWMAPASSLHLRLHLHLHPRLLLWPLRLRTH